MNQKYLEKLEYYKILEMLTSFSITYLGKNMCLALLPSHDSEEVASRLAETEEASRLIQRKGIPPIFAIPNILDACLLLQNGGTLSPKALLELASILKLANMLKEYIKENIDIDFAPICSSYFNRLYGNTSIERTIHSAILDESTIDDKASPALSSIRRNQRNTHAMIKEKLNHYIHSSKYAQYIQESIVTQRNNRFVIPVKRECKNEIKGFVHDTSDSGATVFVEPLSVFDLNNQLNELKLAEGKEIEKILYDLSCLFLPILEELKTNVVMIGALDFAFTKAKFAKDLDAHMPKVSKEKEISFLQARHPLIDSTKAVPIDFSCGKDFTTLVITGPNTGGKTVSLKTAGLFCQMGCSGLFLPAKENSVISIFDEVYVDIGDEQSILASLSTFSSHMSNIIEIVKHASKDSLVLLDELGSGTDPKEGSSLALSILEHLHQKGCLTICTTHFPELKQYCLQTKGFQNASTEFDLETLSPTYHLMMGVPRKKHGF